jgi:hypothetical protein
VLFKEKTTALKMATKLVIVDDSANEILRGAVECPEVVTNVFISLFLLRASCNPEGRVSLPEVNDSGGHLGIVLEVGRVIYILVADISIFLKKLTCLVGLISCRRMPSITERIMFLWSKPTALVPHTCIYTERIKCFEKLAEIQKNLKSADEEYVNVSVIEGKSHENAWNRMEAHTKEYRKEYELCEKIMKY